MSPARLRAALGIALLLVVLVPREALGQGLQDYSLVAEEDAQWRLPRRLRELSGLAWASGDRLFGHDDEHAVIWEIDYREGRLIKGFAMGDPTARRDFEGIAVVGERFYLVTSSGRIYESREGADGDRMLYNTYRTGVGEFCEVEGLEFEPSDRTLLMLCKTVRGDEYLEDFIVIFRWSLAQREITGPPLLVPVAPLRKMINSRTIHPSGIARHPASGHYFIVAAQEGALVEITPDGEVVGGVQLNRRVHRQPEGIAFTSDGTLFLADEGGNGRARLTLYRPR